METEQVRIHNEDKWFAEHHPKYCIGDVLQICESQRAFFPYQYFQVCDVIRQRAGDRYYWGYAGGVGEDRGPYIVVEEYNVTLVMSKEAFEAICSDINSRMPEHYTCEFCPCGDILGINVKVHIEPALN